MGSATEAVVCGALRWSGVAALVRRTLGRRRVSILLYHDPRPDVLARHLQFLSCRGCSFVSLDDVVRGLREGDWDRLPDNAVVITFDDGYRGNFELLELFKQYGVRPTIYLCSQIVGTRRAFWFTRADAEVVERLKRMPSTERSDALARVNLDPLEEQPGGGRQALSAQEVELMRDWVDFHSHTRLHPVLTMCDDEEAEEEILRSKSEITCLTRAPCRHFSYPNGDYTEREVKIVESAGYASARTIDAGWVQRRTNPLRLPILGTPDDASVNRLAADLAGLAWARAALLGRLSGRRRVIAPRSAA
jgi:peptidoglycan/xylan/chitin deacetylase (PgdA/CDA1 family)